ncbi:hypothetical protein PAXRUDRAFT_829440 [Paxillus rubicundulus Ve08.2h10]|uniref:Secreted protein n=1 Tax=Paxillus rubicundulus Ve08.2h10 TaxID=930991 RepID=A0A0D0E039_9AGAM|nr:hypothetical protein PAXRUDRAFT_829440 [Paxillus rubicundulus Ve08.2h10]
MSATWISLFLAAPPCSFIHPIIPVRVSYECGRTRTTRLRQNQVHRDESTYRLVYVYRLLQEPPQAQSRWQHSFAHVTIDYIRRLFIPVHSDGTTGTRCVAP